MTRILVTNDDGVDSPGLHAVVAAIADLAEVSVIAPDRNRSGVSRSITLGQTLLVVEADVPGAARAYATEGTPTDCVRMAALGLVGEAPDLVISGANQGLNVGDDVTYSGTLAAAFEAVFNDVPAIAVSQQTLARELGFPRTQQYDYGAMQQFLRGLVTRVLDGSVAIPASTLVNVNVPGVPAGEVAGVEVTRLGRRIYRDKLELQSEEGGHRRFSLYGDDPLHHEEVGTDIAAVGRNHVSVTPLRFDLVRDEALAEVARWPLEAMLGAAGA
jgi:5'-nucleotidase